MKRTHTGAAAIFACAMAVGLGAQTTPPSGGSGQTQPPTSSTSSASSSEKVTLTGCLEKAGSSAASPTGTSGATGAGASASAGFVLKDATKGSGSSTSATGTSGTATSGTSSAAKGMDYQLEGDSSKLSPHVGHKVEIVGTMGSSSSTGTAGAASSSGSTLKVESVKMIASSCN